ncbi:MAG: hypothetical protein OXC72_01440 [Roseovarius sp.]|nr:hypothetical protein [Roseovarius sp.]MCY4290410.1 hypothetical protein [Roseovarius sp.]
MGRFGGFRRARAIAGRRPSGSVLSRFGAVDVGLEKGEARAAQGRLRRSVADGGEFDLARESRRERLPVREGEHADQTSRVPQIQVPPLVPERPLERPAAALPRLVDREGRHGERSEHVAQMVAAVPRSSGRSVTRANVVVFPFPLVFTSLSMFTQRFAAPIWLQSPWRLFAGALFWDFEMAYGWARVLVESHVAPEHAGASCRAAGRVDAGKSAGRNRRRRRERPAKRERGGRAGSRGRSLSERTHASR